MSDEDMAHGAQSGRRIEAAGRDGDDVAADPLPEQARAALAAETAARGARGLIPAQATLLLEAKIGEGGVGIGADMAVEAPALAAMTVHHVAQLARDGEPNSPAFAAAGDMGWCRHARSVAHFCD